MLKYLLEHNLIDGSCLTVTGKTMAENLAGCPGLKEGQDVILPLERPIKSSGHLQILYGNLSPQGAGEAGHPAAVDPRCQPSSGATSPLHGLPAASQERCTLAAGPDRVPSQQARSADAPCPRCAAVGKITGKEGLVFEGRALCFDCEEDMLAALERDQEQFKVWSSRGGWKGGGPG